jgi:lipopolysaccharide export system protein LptC
MRLGGVALFPLALLATLAALTFWLERAVQVDLGGRDGKGRHDPDFIIDNFTLREFAADGSLKYSAVGPKMIHYADDDSTDIRDPAFTLYRAPMMNLTARQASMSKDGKEVRLSGAVRGLRAATGDSAEAVFASDSMTLYPDDERATSSSRTTLSEGGSSVAGDSFAADKKQRTFALAGRVRGTLQRDKAP